MDDGPIRYILLFVVFLFVSAFCSATETAFTSVNRIRMISLEDEGNKKAKKVLYILDNFDKMLSTILVCNNIANTLCATVSTVFAVSLAKEYSFINSAIAITVATAATTVIIFFFGEMIPKSFAKNCSEKFALVVSAFMTMLMKLFLPFTFVFTAIGRLISKPFSSKDEEEPLVTENELYEIIENIDGVLDDDATELVQQALDFSNICVSDVMTQLDKVVYISHSMSTNEIYDVILSSGHSRLPFKDASGKFSHILLIRKFLKAYISNPSSLNISEILDEAYFVDKGMKIDNVLRGMSENQTNIALVLGEDGNSAGIVTVEDILEELVGEIYDEEDHISYKGGSSHE